MTNTPDYSFMKSGRSVLNEPKKLSQKEIEDIEIILSLFVSNAMLNASKYVEYCERNGVTKEDVIYGIRYEVFEFLKRPDLMQGIEEIKKEYYEQFNEDDEAEEDEEDEEDENSIIVPDEQIENFKRIDEGKINDENKDFINKIHKYYDSWDEWEPKTPIEKILYTSINKMNS